MSQRRSSWPVPNTLNLALSLGVSGGLVGLLALASHSGGAWPLLCALGFAALGQPLFSLIHEAEHDKLHSTHWVNEVCAVLLSALFPGCFSVLRAAHLAHHRRNRSEVELIDYYRPEERTAKTLKYYALISGTIWVGSPLVSVLSCVLPRHMFSGDPDVPRGTNLSSFLTFLAGLRPWRLRLELLTTCAVWVLMVVGLNLRLGPTALCYAAFAFAWASQQYVYHVRTPLHIVEGTFDLRTHPLYGWFILNFNYHLTHHRAVQVPWIHLPEAAEAQPWRPYLRTLFQSWAPPRPLSQAWPQTLISRGPLPGDPPPEFQTP